MTLFVLYGVIALVSFGVIVTNDRLWSTLPWSAGPIERVIYSIVTALVWPLLAVLVLVCAYVGEP